jgi:hypothetical protein
MKTAPPRLVPKSYTSVAVTHEVTGYFSLICNTTNFLDPCRKSGYFRASVEAISDPRGLQLVPFNLSSLLDRLQRTLAIQITSQRQ